MEEKTRGVIFCVVVFAAFFIGLIVVKIIINIVRRIFAKTKMENISMQDIIVKISVTCSKHMTCQMFLRQILKKSQSQNMAKN